MTLRVRILSGLLILWAAGLSDDVTAEIKARRVNGKIVFTSRPDRKPGTLPAAARRTGTASRAMPQELRRIVSDISRRYSLDPDLVSTVIQVESAFDTMAVSPKGARGLMQLMPRTAEEFGVHDVHDPQQNIEGGVAYLRHLLDRYGGDTRLALAAYNAGPTAVDAASGVPDYTETLDYLRRIEARYGRLPETRDEGLTRARNRSIRAARDASGHLVVTNRRGKRTNPATGTRAAKR